MKRAEKLENLLDQLPELKAGDDWDAKLMERIAQKKRSAYRPQAVMYIAVTLILLNVFVMSRDSRKEQKAASNDRLNAIASQLLISTSSSNF